MYAPCDCNQSCTPHIASPTRHWSKEISTTPNGNATYAMGSILDRVEFRFNNVPNFPHCMKPYAYEMHADLLRRCEDLAVAKARSNCFVDCDKERFLATELMLRIAHKGHYNRLTVSSALALFDLVPKTVDKKKFGLVAVACIMVAAKLHQIYTMEIRDYIYIARNNPHVRCELTRDNIISIERYIINNMWRSIDLPAPLDFVQHYIAMAAPHTLEDPAELFSIACMATEIVWSMNPSLCQHTRAVGLAAVLFGCDVLRHDPWKYGIAPVPGTLTMRIKEQMHSLVADMSSSCEVEEYYSHYHRNNIAKKVREASKAYVKRVGGASSLKQEFQQSPSECVCS